MFFRRKNAQLLRTHDGDVMAALRAAVRTEVTGMSNSHFHDFSWGT